MNPLEARIQFFADKMHIRMMEIEDQIDLQGGKDEKKLMAKSEQVEQLLLEYQELFNDILHLELD